MEPFCLLAVHHSMTRQMKVAMLGIAELLCNRREFLFRANISVGTGLARQPKGSGDDLTFLMGLLLEKTQALDKAHGRFCHGSRSPVWPYRSARRANQRIDIRDECSSRLPIASKRQTPSKPLLRTEHGSGPGKLKPSNPEHHSLPAPRRPEGVVEGQGRRIPDAFSSFTAIAKAETWSRTECA